MGVVQKRNDMIQLTDKCKEMFEEYTKDKSNYISYKPLFSKLPMSMKFGVYVDFADSLGVKLDVIINREDTYSSWVGGIGIEYALPTQKTRNEAREKAIEMLNKYVNENY